MAVAVETTESDRLGGHFQIMTNRTGDGDRYPGEAWIVRVERQVSFEIAGLEALGIDPHVKRCLGVGGEPIRGREPGDDIVGGLDSGEFKNRGSRVADSKDVFD